jgi:serine/threonine protein kinase
MNANIENNTDSLTNINHTIITHKNLELSKDDNIHIIESPLDSPKKKNSIADFDLFEILGRGSYAKVVHGKNIYTNESFAIKIIDKNFLEREDKVYEVHIEKYMLSLLHHPNIIKLYSTFQDRKKLYFILEYCPNRDLSEFIRCQGKIV